MLTGCDMLRAQHAPSTSSFVQGTTNSVQDFALVNARDYSVLQAYGKEAWRRPLKLIGIEWRFR